MLKSQAMSHFTALGTHLIFLVSLSLSLSLSLRLVSSVLRRWTSFPSTVLHHTTTHFSRTLPRQPWMARTISSSIGAVSQQGRPSQGSAASGGANLDEGTEFMSRHRLWRVMPRTRISSHGPKVYGQELGPLVPELYKNPEMPAPLCLDERHPRTKTSLQWQGAMRSAGDSTMLCPTREMLFSIFGVKQ